MLPSLDSRISLFAGIPLAGRRVLDFQAGRGELLRLALREGARYAEGIEADWSLVDAGRLANAAFQVEGAVLRHGDLRQPGCLLSDFEVGVCASGFDAYAASLPDILEHVRELLMVRVVTGEHEWYRRCVLKLAPWMSFWSLLPSSGPASGRTAKPHGLLVTSRTVEPVAAATLGRCKAVGLEHPDVRSLDVYASGVAAQSMGSTGPARLLFGDLRRKLSRLTFGQPLEIAALIKPMLAPLRVIVSGRPPQEVEVGTDRYWLRFLQGLVNYIENGALNIDNPYVRFVRGVAACGMYDSAMSYYLEEETRALARLRPRLKGFIEVLTHQAVAEPLIVFNPVGLTWLEAYGYKAADFPRDHHMTLTNGARYRIQGVDGTHRLAALWLSGAATGPVLPVWTNVFGVDAVLSDLVAGDSSNDMGLQTLTTQAVYEFAVEHPRKLGAAADADKGDEQADEPPLTGGISALLRRQAG